MIEFEIRGRKIGQKHPPLVIAEIGINHEGNFEKALQMVDDAKLSGCECVKFQYHVVEDEMIPNNVIPGNASVSIWEIISRCALSNEEEKKLKRYVEQTGLIYLSTPFSRAASDCLDALGVDWYKIGSGECNNYPLIEHIAGFGRPVVLSTGMNDIESISPGVNILREHGLPFALLHCTSMYPTPYELVRLGAIPELQQRFGLPVGLSDHSLGIYTCLGAVALGACVLEKLFTMTRSWPGPDVPISIEPTELAEMVKGSRAIWSARGGHKTILPEEQPVIDFAYATVVTIMSVRAGECFSRENTWVKRPGTGKIFAEDFEKVLGMTAARDVPAHVHVDPEDLLGRIG